MNTHDKYELPPPTELFFHSNGDGEPVRVRGYTSEQVIAAIEADRKRRGEPVAWIYEDELPDNYPYEAMFPYSKVDGVRMFPVYAPQPAEPVKVPSDDELASLADEVVREWQANYKMPPLAWGFRQFLVAGMHALLDRYGQPAGGEQ